MKSKNLLFLVAIVALATSAAQAQNIGFSVGLQRPPANSPAPPMVRPPVQAFAPAPVRPRIRHFGVTPSIMPPISVFPPAFYFPSQIPASFPHAPVFVGPNRLRGPYLGPYDVPYGATTVIVPNGTVITNSTVVVQQPAGQILQVGPPESQPVTTAATPQVNGQRSLVGMSREQVIQLLGRPISGLYTQSGETLSFNGGVTVVIQNGKVVLPN